MKRIAPAVLVLFAAAVSQGCQCQASVPNTDNDDDDPIDTSIDTAVVETADTAPEPVCRTPEVEPNGQPGEETDLLMEQWGCGEFSAPLDIDLWTFDLNEDEWLGVRVVAQSLGSFADVHLLIDGDSGTSARRANDEESRDAELLFPAVADTYTLAVTEENLQGDKERYYYEVLATVSKEPVEWNVDEVPDHADQLTAQLLGGGDTVFGIAADGLEDDWYTVEIPAGRHTLTLDIDAFELGSPGDFTLFLYDSPDDGASPVRVWDAGEFGWERDPWGEYTSGSGDEVLYIRVDEEDGNGGPAYWYAMHVTLESS